MRILITVYFILSNSVSIFAQNPGPNISWQKCYGTSGNDGFLCVEKIPNENAYLASANFKYKDHFLANEPNAGQFILKFDSNFNMIWKKDIPLVATKILFLEDNSVILAGLTSRNWNKGNVFQNIHGSDLSNADFAIIKYNSNCQNVIWAKAYGSTGIEDQLNDIILSDGGDFIFSGWSAGSNGDLPDPSVRPCFNPFNMDAYFLKIDSIGNLKWVKMIGGTNGEAPGSYLIKLDSNRYRIDIGSNSNDCDFAGTLPFTGMNYRTLSIIIDNNGNELKRVLDETGKLFQHQLMGWKKKDKTYIIGYGDAKLSYHPTFPAHNKEEGVIAVYDDSLNVLSQHLFGGTGIEFFLDHIYDQDGNHLFFGLTTSSDNSGDIKNYKGGENDFWLLKTDTNFKVIWSKTFGSNQIDGSLYYNYPTTKMILSGTQLIVAFKIYPPSYLPNNDVLCGLRYADQFDTTRVYSDAWLVAFDLSTGIEMIPIKEATNFKLYPNPSSNLITIQNSNPTGKLYKVSIINLLGKTLKEIQYEDTKVFSLSIEDIEDGMYYFSIQKNKKQLFTQKILVKK